MPSPNGEEGNEKIRKRKDTQKKITIMTIIHTKTTAE
jgi:hypothetical protein